MQEETASDNRDLVSVVKDRYATAQEMRNDLLPYTKRR